MNDIGIDANRRILNENPGFFKVKGVSDCRLVLSGSVAMDDPEGLEFHEKVNEKAA